MDTSTMLFLTVLAVLVLALVVAAIRRGRQAGGHTAHDVRRAEAAASAHSHNQSQNWPAS